MTSGPGGVVKREPFIDVVAPKKYTVAVAYSLLPDSVYNDVTDFRVLDSGALKFVTADDQDGLISAGKTVIVSAGTRWTVYEQ